MITCFNKVFNLKYDDAQDGFMFALLYLDYTKPKIFNMLRNAYLQWSKNKNYYFDCSGTGMMGQTIELFRTITTQKVKWWKDEELNDLMLETFSGKFKEDYNKMKMPFDK